MTSNLAEAVNNEVLFYVATNGNDSWSGKLSEPNQNQTDGPFASLPRAQEAIRQLKRHQGNKLNQPVKVSVRGGVYFLNEPLTFTSEDSGTKSSPISYEAYADEEATISGGRLVYGWKEVLVDGKKLWALEIPKVREGSWFFRELWVNGGRRFRARHPNKGKGYLKVDQPLDVTPQSQWHEGQRRFRFHQDDLKAWKTATDAEVIVMCRWVESHLPIRSIDDKENVVSFEKRSVFRLDPGDPYYIEGAFELLDEPGEWHLDRKEGILYYMPIPGEELGQLEAIAPILSQLVHFDGKPESGQFIENLTFRKLKFSHAQWYFPESFQSNWPKPDVGGFPQAAIGVPGAVSGNGMRHCSFEACSFSNLGSYAIELGRGCQGNQIVDCQIFDLGAGGIKIGETVIRDAEAEQTHSNQVINCHIQNGGLIFHSAVGVWVGQSYDNRIIGNQINDFYYTGISIGWTWGYGRALAKGNVVERNKVHHIGVRSDGDGPILSDMGGIYTLGMQPGTTVRYNLFHDIAAIRYGGWGIYFDEGSTHIVAENNVVYRTTHGGFHQHYGRENLVKNNIFAFGQNWQIQRTRPEDHISFTFERNIVCWNQGKLLSGNLANFNIKFDNNLYWFGGEGGIQISNLSWEEWRDKGMDKNSIVADPGFVDLEKGDFRLKPDSMAVKVGFVPFEIR